MSPAAISEETRVTERWNEVFEAIAAEPRRQLVIALLDTPPDESAQLPGAAASPSAPANHRSLRQALIHRHLPKLDAHDFVRWERDPLRATRGPRFEELAAVVESLWASAGDLPDQLVSGCRRLEDERSSPADEP